MTNKSNLKFVVKTAKKSWRFEMQSTRTGYTWRERWGSAAEELERGKKESTVKRVLTIHSILV